VRLRGIIDGDADNDDDAGAVSWHTNLNPLNRCSAYLTSLLYVELWCEKEIGQLQLPPDESYSRFLDVHGGGSSAGSSNGSDRMAVVDQDETPPYMELLLGIYSNINEPDSIYGLQRNQRYPLFN
jgi:hypothetical protein